MLIVGCNNPSGGSSIARNHTPGLQPPGAFDFSLIQSADGDANVSWHASARVETYTFYMGTDPNDISTPVSCTSGRTSCTVTGLTNNTLYYFKVKASNAAGTIFTTSVGRARPIDSTGFDLTTSTPSNGTVTYAWTSAALGATSYRILYGTRSGTYSGTLSNAVSPQLVTGLANGTTYYARVVAVNADNGYALSPTELSAQPVGPLPAPVGLSAVASPNITTLDWADSSGAVSYEIWDSTGMTMYGTSATSDFVHTHNSNGTPFSYKVRAINVLSAPGTFSSVVNSQSVAAFTMISATAGPLPGQATVSWNSPVTGATGFDIRYGSNPASLNLLVSNVTTPYVFSGLTGGLTYYFTVVAKNAVGSGANQPSTNQLSATPVAPIAPPTGLTASATPSGITLTWNAVAGATKYKIYRNTVSGGHTYLNEVTAPTTTFFDGSAAPNGTTYYYVVRSHNGLDSADSLEVFKQPINNFTFTSATVATFSSADLVWGNATAASGYDILYGTSSGNYTGTSLNRTSPATLTGLTASTTYFVVIRAKNSAGGGTTLLSNELTFTTGTLYPTVTISSAPLINNANKAGYTVNGTCSEEGRSVGLNVGGVTSSATCTSLAWTITLDVTAAADSAARAVTATHTNSGGNSDTDTVNVVKDTINPTVAITAYPAINATNEAAYTAGGTCSENGRTVNVSVGGINSSATCTSLAWSVTVNTSALSDSGAVSILADTTDAAGNSATQATRSVVKDTVPPSVAISSAPTINNANKASYSLSGTCSETGQNVVVKVGAVTSTVSCTLLTWSTTMNVTTVADAGGVVVLADHSDASGNAAAQASTLVLKDTVNPNVAIISAPTIISSNDNAYPISGTCSENTRTVNVSVGGVTSAPVCTAGAWSAVLDVSGLSDSPSIAASATHTDAALNSATASTTVAKQTALPTVTISSNTAINNTNKAAYTVNGTCSHNGRVVTVNVGGVSATPTCTTLAWTATLNVTAVADSGAVTITADHVDAVGNAAIQATTSVLKDTIIPTVAITSSPAINNSNKSAYTVSGTCSENTRTVSVNVAGVSASPSCSSSAWTTTVDVSAVADGASKTITANHTDLAGNAATQASVTVLKDTSIPTVSITTFPAINNANKSAYTVSGACSENTRTVSVSVGGVSATPTCTALAWSATLNVSSLSDSGAVSITADHSDLAGNAATQATRSVVKDTAIPTVAITSTPVINNSNKNAYTVSGTCSDSGQSVSVAVGIATGSVTCTILTWSITLNVSGNTDSASLLITADHTDAVGNAAVQAGTTTVKDTLNPTVTIASAPVINNANKSSYTVSGTCSENSRAVSVSVGGITATPTCSALSWTTTLDVSALSDGPAISITANHSDSAGNNATQASTSVVKQTALPTVAITSSPVINNANKASYTVSGTCSEIGRVVTVNVGGVSASPNCAASAWTATLNVTAVADNGSVTITADHSDAVGNNATQATASVLKDTVLPTVAITASPVINNSNVTAYTVSGTCSENGRTVSVLVGSVSGSPSCTTGAWSTTLNVTAVADSGTVSVSANHTDLAGNAATPATATVVKDTSNPTVTIAVYPVINNANKAAYTVSGACSENSRVVSVNVGGVTSTPTCTSSAWSATLNVSAVADNASVSITADHSDASGNNATQATRTVLKDTSNPTVAITSSTIINNANKSSYTVTGTCSENTRTVSVSVGGVTGSPTCTTNNWSTTVNVTAVSDSATVSITADHTDAAGNSATQATASVLKDTVNPTVAITSSPGINSVNAAAYPISGTCSENTRIVTVNVGGVSGTPTCSGGAWSATLNVVGVADSGSVPVSANHTDAAGNSATPATTTVNKTTTTPTVSIAVAPAINNANKSAYTLSGACSVNTRPVSVNVGGVSGTPTCSGNAWSATLYVSGVSDGGAISVTADHNDGLGNNAPQASTTVVKDTVIPTVAITSSPVINNANKSAYTFSGTCSENTRTVSVSAGGVSGSGTCSTGAWSATVNVAGVADGGSISLTADHTDAAGNNATQATTTVVKDTSNPTVTISAPVAINNTNKSSYPVSGTCSENTRTVSVTVGGVAGSATCSATSWSTNVNVSAVADSATVTITADHTDASGNSATTASASVLKDTVIPTVAITSSPSINNTNKASYTVSGTCSENSQSVLVNVGGVSGSATCTTGNWTRTLNVTAVSDSGSVSVTADHADVAGNSATQATASVVKDTVIPTVAITAPVAINNTNKSSYPISGTCSENTRTVSVVVGGVSGSATCTTGAWSATLNVSGVGDGGSIAVTADHTDAAGNSATTATASTSKDTTPPTVAVTSNVAINNTNKNSYLVSGTCSENTRTVTVSVGGVGATPTCTTGTWSTTVNVSALADSGAVAITADHTDAAGNNATQGTASVLKDTVIPTVSILSAPAINNSNKASYPLSGACSENTRNVSVSVGSVSGTVVCSALAWSTTLNVTAVADGASVSVTADHTDAALNSATQATTTVLKDTSAPTVGITIATVINNPNKTSYTVSGSCSENTRTVSVNIGGISSTPTCSGTAWSTTVDVSSLSDGSVTITANHSDLAGNAATQASTSVTKDTANPTVAITSNTAINNTNKASYPVSGTCSENTRTVSFTVGGVSASATCTTGAWSGTINVTAVSDSGAVAITADHTDAAGNSATQAIASVLKDTVIPTVAIVSAPAINNGNKASYTLSGTCSENTRTVNVAVGSVNGTPSCSSGNWTTTLNVTALSDSASITVTANHTDVAGNAATQASTTVLKDTLDPTVAITAPGVINNANKAAYTVSGSCSENTRIVSVNVGGVTATPSCSGGAWTTTLNLTGVSDGGSIAFTANHSDANGNAAPQASASAVKDTLVPTITIASAPSITNSNRTAYTVTGTCSENTRTVSVLVGSVAGAPTCTTGNWSVTLNVSAVTDSASVAVSANHTDAAGNPATTASTTVIKDTGIPTVGINSPAVINNANKTSYTVTGSCSETGRTVSVMVGSVSASDTCTLLAWTVTVNVIGVLDSASVLITADLTDAVGNAAVQAGTTTVKDTVVPTVAITSSPLINNANKAAYTVSGTCSENTLTVSVSVGGVTATPSCSSGAWSSTMNVTAAADSATLAITANHSDSAGNAATTASTTVVKDTSNPTVAITSSPTINIANVSAYTVSGTCSENTRTVTVSIGGVGAAPVCSAGSWTTGAINVGAATDSATLSITANHTDASGNSATQASASVLKDTVAPTVAFSTAAGNPTFAPFTVRATFSETVTGVAAGDFTLSNATGSGFTAVSGTLYDLLVTPSSEALVTVNMAAAAASDTAGNPSTAATQLSRTYQAPAVLSFADSSTYDFGSLATGGSADVTMLINKTGTPNATSVTEISLAPPFAFKGGSYPGTGGSCGTTISGSCSIVVTYSPTAAGTHNDFVQLQYNNAAGVVSVSRAITGTASIVTPTKVIASGPAGITINQCVPYVIKSATAAELQANVSANQTVNLVANNVLSGTAIFYSNNTCATVITSTTIAANTSSVTVYFRATAAAQNLTLVFTPATLAADSIDVVTSNAPTKISSTPPAEMETNTCLPVTLDLTDASGNKTGKNVAVQVNLTTTGSLVYYSDVLCTGTITSTTLAAYQETATIYVKNTAQQSVTLTMTDNAAALTSDTSTVNFVNALTWWNNAYARRIPITINNSDQAAAHTDIQVLVRLNSSRINYSDIQSAGQDIRFTLDDHATSLSYDIESWDSSGTSFVWVKIPSLAASTTRIIYMYYDNPVASDGQSAASTWTGYQGVWNGDKTGANYYDATNSGKNGVIEGTVTDVDGPNGKAINFNAASSSAINVGSNLATVLGTNATMSFWIKTTQAGNTNFYAAPTVTGIRSDTTGFNEIYFGWLRNTGAIGIQSKNGATPAVSGFAVNDGAWRHVTMHRTSASGVIKFYVNGVLNGTGASGTGAVTNAFTKIGARVVASGTSQPVVYFDGALDGIRMYNSVQTDARIRAEYKFSVETNISYGPAEQL